MVLIYTPHYCEISYCSISFPMLGVVTLYILSVWWVYDTWHYSFHLHFPDQYFRCLVAIWIDFIRIDCSCLSCFPLGYLSSFLISWMSILCHIYGTHVFPWSLISFIFSFIIQILSLTFKIIVHNYQPLPLRLVPFCILFRKCFHSIIKIFSNLHFQFKSLMYLLLLLCFCKVGMQYQFFVPVPFIKSIPLMINHTTSVISGFYV